jgi:aspartate ammonia-lyase
MGATHARVERDSLGEVGLPAGALYGAHTARALRTLCFSGRTLGDYPAFLRALAMVKKAAARANRAAGVIAGDHADAIEAACDVLIEGQHREQFPVDVLGGGGWIGVNMNVNEVVANLANQHFGATPGTYAPVHPKTHVNASQSTADVCHTAIRLAVLAVGDDLQVVLSACEAALQRKAVDLRPLTTLSRTCLQDGLPVSLGDCFGAYASVVARRQRGLRDSLGALQINLGGTVIGSGSGAPAAYRQAVPRILAALSGRDLAVRADLYDAAQHIDDLVGVSSQLALLAEVLIKLAQDLRLLSSGPRGGFGEIVLPATQEGSSFFPGKINPVVPETLLHACFEVLGCDRVAHLALERGEPNLNVFESAAGINVLDAMGMLTRALGVFVAHCLVDLRANEARCAELAGQAVGGA